MNEVTTAVSASKKTTAGRAAWILLIIAWVLFIIPIPGLGWVGWVLNFVAFILSIVALSQGGVKAGIWQLLGAILISPIVYWLIGIPLLADLVVHGVQQH